MGGNFGGESGRGGIVLESSNSHDEVFVREEHDEFEQFHRMSSGYPKQALSKKCRKTSGQWRIYYIIPK